MGKIAFLFAGQGSQYPGMGKEFYEQSQKVKDLFDYAETFRPGTKAQCFEGTKEQLSETVNTQPCLYLTDLACALALEEHHIYADVTAGFSLGEIAALAQAKIMTPEEGFSVVCNRGKWMDACAHETEGEMVAVIRMPTDALEKLCEEYQVYPVNYNCPGQVSVSGCVEHMTAFRQALEEQGVRFVPIQVSGAFHTPYMQKAGSQLAEQLENMQLQQPKIPLYANLTAEPYPMDVQQIGTYVSKQVCNPVLWEKTLQNMYENGVRIFVECGPGKTLSGFVKKTLKNVCICNVSDTESLEKTIQQIQDYQEM